MSGLGKTLLISFGFALTLFVGGYTFAEPWISNRYAQNCSSCHSPSRRNVPVKDRRCTLSCQGCHVNPSGGGLRNEYGMWNQQRWLRSFKSSTLASKGLPAPLKKQKYGSMPVKINRRQLALYKKMAKDGAPLVVAPGVDYAEHAYDRSDKQEHITVKSRAEFLARLTKEDPWRLERQRHVFAGGDFRFMYFDGDVPRQTGATAIKRSVDGIGPMAFDMGLKVRPTRENVSFVFESRFLNNPNIPGQESLEWAFTAGSQVRSAYALVDDLPYNMYVQYGLYKPMFGHYNPDHSTLLNHLVYSDNSSPENIGIQARQARSINKVLTIGGSPNVPFVNLHWIQPMDSKSYPMSGEGGFAVNLGGRFVTLGASFMLSYWSTKGYRLSTATQELKTEMMSASAGFAYKRFIINGDFSRIEKEFAPGAVDAGSVQTLESKYRLWRETYAFLNYASSNVNRSLKQGKAGEMAMGVKAFLTQGTEVEVQMVSRTDRNSTSTVNSETLIGQVHFFF
jgi:hypothetical protein